jgi:tetratricopeptide (TPR) repeat protein
MGEMNQAFHAYQESLKCAEAISEKKSIANALNNIGLLHQRFADYSAALENYLKSLRLFQELGDRYGEASVRVNIGIVYELNQEYGKALKEYQSALTVYRVAELEKRNSKDTCEHRKHV